MKRLKLKVFTLLILLLLPVSTFSDDSLNVDRLNIKSISLDYVVAQNSIRIGNVQLNEETLGLEIIKDTDNTFFLKVRWPVNFDVGGHLEMVDKEGQVFWSALIDRTKMTTEKKNDGEIYTSDKIRLVQDQLISVIEKKGQFRYCLNHTFSGLGSKYCSPLMSTKRLTWYLRLIPEGKKKLTTEVEIDGNKAPPAGLFLIQKYAGAIKFKSTFPSGAFIDFDLKVRVPKIEELAQKPNSKELQVTGSQAVLIGKDNEKKSSRWIASVSTDRPHIYIGAVNGIPIRLDFEYKP